MSARGAVGRLGRPVVYALVAEDGSAAVVGRFVPAPYEAAGPGGCRLAVDLANARGSQLWVRGDGFRPGEAVDLSSAFAGLAMPTVPVAASAAGGFGVSLLPPPQAGPGGPGTTAAAGRACSVPAVPFRWGTAQERG